MAVDETGQHRSRYPAEVRRRVYMLWAYECGQDAREVHQRIATDPEMREAVGLEEGEAVPKPITIAKWAETDLWSWKAMQEMQDSFPVGVRYGAIKLTSKGTQAVNTVEKIMSRYNAGEKLTGSDKIALDTCFKLIELTYGDNISAHIKHQVETEIDLAELAGMSLEQLAEEERKMLGG